MAKTFSLEWAFEAFIDDPTFLTKRMFGGLAAYVHGRMVMVIFENPGDKEYRGEHFSYDIWNGILFPTEREFHGSLFEQFPEFVSHPVLGKWLYLPMSTPHFERDVECIGNLIQKDDSRFGIYPKPKKRRPMKSKSVKKQKKISVRPKKTLHKKKKAKTSVRK
jgi:hypothetical protein